MSDSPVIAFINKVTDLIVLNLLWLVTSLPIVTIGASTSAMFYVSIRSVSHGDGYVWKNYWRAFRQNFKQATIVWILLLLAVVTCIFDLKILEQIDNKGVSVGVSLVIYEMLIVFGLVALYIFPVIAKFENSLIRQIKNALAFAIGYLPYTLVMLVIVAVFVFVNLKTMAANMIMLVVGFSLLSYILSFFYFKVFQKHTGEVLDIDVKE